MQPSFTKNIGFTLTRQLKAPPDLVFKAWTDPAYLVWFFNPGWPTDVETSVDLRVGGQWRQQMIIDGTTRYITGGIYREIVPNEKLVFSFGAIGGWPELDPDKLEDSLVTTVTFTPNGAGTEMALTMQMPDHMATPEALSMFNNQMRAGWGMTIDRLVGFGGL